jgi:hypothetical protein
MPRTIQRLSDTTVKSQKLKPGRHSDGGGLYLNVGPTGTKSWLFMWTRDVLAPLAEMDRLADATGKMNGDLSFHRSR